MNNLYLYVFVGFFNIQSYLLSKKIRGVIKNINLPLTYGLDFGIFRLLGSGGIAQLGERLICIQKVAGSIPVTSTKSAS